MGQYHKVVNLDKLEFVHPHKLGCGLKLWEQLANSPGTGAALIVLLASASNGAGGGDLNDKNNWYPGSVGMVGRWRGDRVAFVGDYDETVYMTQCGPLTGAQIYDGDELPSPCHWVDISDQVAKVIEEELGGVFEGDGWRNWKQVDAEPAR